MACVRAGLGAYAGVEGDAYASPTVVPAFDAALRFWFSHVPLARVWSSSRARTSLAPGARVSVAGQPLCCRQQYPAVRHR
ncbi:MAG: hypothetical protein IPJ36_11680 [Simplicispira sp.]|nr:hypothetical protein [Simplicispira sp.]